MILQVHEGEFRAHIHLYLDDNGTRTVTIRVAGTATAVVEAKK